MTADEGGSIVAVTDCGGNLIASNNYDEYGIPGSGNYGRFQYTGQMWLPELGMYYYKARIYSPTLGRFMQADPIGYGDGMNMYAYVGNDPINFTDPSGMVISMTTGSGTYGFNNDTTFNPWISNGQALLGADRWHPFWLQITPEDEDTLITVIADPCRLARSRSQCGSSSGWSDGGDDGAGSTWQSMMSCAGRAIGENGLGLALDAAGWALELAPVTKVGKALGGMAVGAAGMVAGAMGKDPLGAGLGYLGKQGAVGGGLGVAAAKRLGTGALIASTAYDVAKTWNAYNSCRQGR